MGLTAIYALTGKQPQELQTDPSTGEFLWQQYATSISPSLAAVLNKTVQSHPRDRFHSALEMLQALQSPPAVPAYTPTIPSPLPVAPTPQPVSPVPPSPLPATLNNAPPTQTNSLNALIIGSLVASGLIGAAVVIALAINRQPSQPNPVASSVTSANSSTPATNPPPSLPSSPPSVAVDPPPPPPPSRPPSNLASDAGIDYSYLENLLASGKFRSADRETTNLMVKMGSPGRATYLDPQSFWRIPCTDLRTIDRLWRQYSNGKFGFSVQKGIWQQVGRSKSGFDRYVDWSGKKYDNIIFSRQAPTGHLPYVRVLKHEEFFNGDRCF